MMSKIVGVLCGVLMAVSLVACGSEPEHTLTYIDYECVEMLDQYDCIAIYTQYVNGSSETAIPADWVDVKAFQNGTEIPILVPTGETINGYIQCDASVQSGVTADVVWYFQLEDNSDVTVEISDRTEVKILLK